MGGLLYGVYAPQLLEWVQVFSREQLVISPSEFMFENPAGFMDELSEYLLLDRYDWTSITKNTFNIINPKSRAGSVLELATNDGRSLQVGKSDTTSDYPPLDPEIRKNLIAKMAPFNEALASVLQDDTFLMWNQVEEE